MGHDAIKLELIEWLTQLDDDDTLDFLKIVKESRKDNQDWWFDCIHPTNSIFCSCTAPPTFGAKI